MADAGVEVLGEPGFYAQLLTAPDVEFLVQSALHGVAADDFVASEAELTGLLELFAAVADTFALDKVGHSRRVANLAVLVAMAMGRDTEEVARIKWAALVHDLGVITVPKDLLDKPGHLSSAEMAQVRGHAAATHEFLAPIRGLEEVACIAGSHREAFDGSGYPQGLAGRDIPLGARILAVCDTFDALTSHRPYREARDTTLSIDILIKGSGSLFDPDVVDAAVPALLIARSPAEPEAVERRDGAAGLQQFKIENWRGGSPYPPRRPRLGTPARRVRRPAAQTLKVKLRYGARLRSASASARVGSDGIAPTRVQAMAPTALALRQRRTSVSRSSPSSVPPASMWSSRLTMRLATKPSPAPVHSTTLTRNPGTNPSPQAWW